MTVAFNLPNDERVREAYLGRPEDALESYDRALAHRPKYVDALINRANTLRLLGRHDEALTSFERAVLFKPGHAEGYLGHGNALLALKRLAEAVHSYDRAIALAPAATLRTPSE